MTNKPVVTKQSWITKGFEAFRAGTFGNAGQNLYVSRAGILQRIHQVDFNGDGYLDLVFCNSQNHWERVPTSVFADLLNDTNPSVELPAEGAWGGVVADLNGDGYDDLVVANWYNGVRYDLSSSIYYGSPTGWSERRQQILPAPYASAVAAGDFNGDGRPDLAFISKGKLRIFYQNALGYEPKRYVDLDVVGQQATATDLDGDGYADLVIRTKEGLITIYWGGADGIHPERTTTLPEAYSVANEPEEIDPQAGSAEYAEGAHRLVTVVHLGNIPHIYAALPEKASLVPVLADRSFGAPLTFACRKSYTVAASSLLGNGQIDLVFACREPNREANPSGDEVSWIYWGGADGYTEERRTPLACHSATDVAVADLDEDGYAEIILCQGHINQFYTSQSLVYRVTPTGIADVPLAVTTHDARRVLVGAAAGRDAKKHVAFINFYGRNRWGNMEPTIYWGGSEGFSPENFTNVPGWGPVEIIGCDINDDGFPDMVVANASENSVDRAPGSYIVLNGPDGFAQEPSVILPVPHAHGVCCADINGDGYLDLIFCRFNNSEISIFYGSENGYDLENPQLIKIEYDGVVYDQPRWIYLADLNNDGWLDLVIPEILYDRSFILWGGPEGFSMDRSQALSVVRGACARAADLNGNGYLDLIIGGHMPALDAPHDSFAYIYWNGPDGISEANRTLLPAKTINSMVVADFNNDGTLDLYIGSYHGGLERDVDSYIYWNRAGKGFSAMDRTRFFTHSASGSMVGDFNGDGWIDLAIANHKVNGDHVGFSAVWWNGPDGFDEKRVTKLPTTGPHGMMAVEPTNLVDRGPTEEYLSSPHQLSGAVQVTGVSWQADLPVNTWVQAQIRWADSANALEAAAWVGPEGEGSWYTADAGTANTVSAAGWLQYRLLLGAKDGCGTPRVHEVAVHYS